MTMPRDPQGAGTRTESYTYWRNVYPNRTAGCYESREFADEGAFPDRIAIERIVTTTTITREEL